MTTQHDNRISAAIEELLAQMNGGNPLPALEARGVTEDSRAVCPGDVFVAIEGLTVDGHAFVAQAVAAGAVAVVCERPIVWPPGSKETPVIVVRDSARALGLLSSALFGHPTRTLSLSGITGTNGKSTTAYLLRSILSAARQRTGLIGTIEYSDSRTAVPAPYTTPSAAQLQGWLARMVTAGATHAVMEVSSHGLQLGRTWGCEFDLAAFSNLTQDHLDLHGTMERYLDAKLLLFSRHLKAGGIAVVNLDGEGSEAVARCARRRGDVRLLGCSSGGQHSADVRLQEVDHRLEGLSGTLLLGQRHVRLSSPLVGAFNADNILLAAACAHALGLPDEVIATGVRQLAGVPGRLERVSGHSDCAVFVDYAHTPDALYRALGVLRPLCEERLIVVFGCGGDRDRGKRPLMGRAAATQADLVVVTSDNPRSEDPAQILAEIVPTVAETLPKIERGSAAGSAERGYWVEPDRAKAIEQAVGALRSGDILLLAGKGHETYQLVGGQRLAFDDREQARQALMRRTTV